MPADRILDDLAFGRRAAVDLRPESYDAETDTLKVTWFTNPEAIETTRGGQRYRCILGTDPAKVDLDFANKGQPIPFGHQRWEPECGPNDRAYVAQGVPGSFTFDGSRGDCEIKLSSIESDKPVTDKIRAGMFRAVSLEWEPTDAGRDQMTVEYPAEGSRDLPIVRVPEWRLRTIVIVPFGADEGAGIRSRSNTTEVPMPEPIAPVTPAPKPTVDLSARNALILDLGRRAKMPQADLDALILKSGDELDETGARTAILTAWADAQKNEPETKVGVRVQVTREETDTKVKGIASALGVRMFGGAFEPEAEGFRGADAAGLCAALLDVTGVRASGVMDKHQIADAILHGGRTHATIDFTNVFSNLLNKRLVPERAMSADYDWWKTLASRQDFADYLPVTYVDIGAVNNLPHVKEGAEYTRATFGDAVEQTFCLKYGVELALTEEMIVNDRLSAFARLVRGFLRAASLSESALAATAITANPTMGDNVALFAEAAWDWKRNPSTGAFYNAGGHANLAGSGAVVSPTTLDAGDLALRTQVGIDGVRCGQPARVLLAPAGKRFGIEQLFSPQYKPTSKTDAVTVDIPADRRIYPPQFTGTAWYLATGDTMAMEFGYLIGEGGPVVQRYAEPKRDALVFHARDVFGIKVLDPRAFYCNPGA